MNFPKGPERPELAALLKSAAEAEAKLTPLQRAVNYLRGRQGYVASEMTVDDNDLPKNTTREQHIVRMNTTMPEYIVLAEMERLAAETKVLRDALGPLLFGDPVLERILFGDMEDDALCTVTIKLKHLRRARIALRSTPTRDGK